VLAPNNAAFAKIDKKALDALLADKVSISPTFYKNLCCTKVLRKAFLYLQFGLVIFFKRILAQKLLVKYWWNWLQEGLKKVLLRHVIAGQVESKNLTPHVYAFKLDRFTITHFRY